MLVLLTHPVATSHVAHHNMMCFISVNFTQFNYIVTRCTYEYNLCSNSLRVSENGFVHDNDLYDY